MDDRAATLIRLVEDNPDDVDAYRAYGDYLEEQGDPRGKLMGMQIVRDQLTDRAKLDHLENRLEAFFEEHRAHFLGPLAKVMPGPAASRQRRDNALELVWRYGFIHKAVLRRLTRPKMHAFLDMLLAHPSGQFLVELGGIAAEDPPALFAVLAARAPRSLRRLQLSGTDGTTSYGIGAIWPRLERLEALTLSGASDFGDIVLPALRTADIDVSTPQSLRSLATAQWPKLESLRLRISPERATADDIVAVLDRELPALRSLKLQFEQPLPEVLRRLSKLPLSRQLTALELGLVSRQAMDTLVHCTFQLDELRVPDVFPELRPRLQHLAKRIEVRT